MDCNIRTLKQWQDHLQEMPLHERPALINSLDILDDLGLTDKPIALPIGSQALTRLFNPSVSVVPKSQKPRYNRLGSR